MRPWTLVLIAALMTCGCATVGGRAAVDPDDSQVGRASFYARRFEGHRTASGDRYQADRLTAAHRTLPFGTRVRVTNLANDRSIVVTVNDRGPRDRSRIIDLSRRAARELGFVAAGTTSVRIEVVSD